MKKMRRTEQIVETGTEEVEEGEEVSIAFEISSTYAYLYTLAQTVHSYSYELIHTHTHSSVISYTYRNFACIRRTRI